MLRNVATVIVLCSVASFVQGEEMDCYGAGSIAGAVIGTLIVTLTLLALIYFVFKCYVRNKREKHLVLETDPEQGDKYAFDNPCFKDASNVSGGLTPIGKALDKSGTKLLDTGKKWSQWSPLGAFVSTKNEKKRTLDDTHIDNGEIKVVSLRSQDFTGLGFNICGNMRDGIYIKDVLHHGPAFDSGKLNSGDRINSVRISFEHMVYEDALTILSYASPYEVEIEAKSCCRGPPGSGGQGAEPKHPIYRSSSSSDLVKIGKSVRKGLIFQEVDANTDYTTLQISSNNTTLEHGQKSPRTDINSLTKPERIKKSQLGKNLSPDQLKLQLEQNLAQKITQPINTHIKNKIEAEKQTSEVDNKNKYQKFGVRVLPMEDNNQRSPKSAELSQNDNNINQERQTENSEGRDEVDKNKINGKLEIPPPVKKRDKNKNGDLKDISPETKEPDNFQRQDSLNSSGIKRDKEGIPQEIPDHMLQAAVAARKNRKSIDTIEKPETEDNEAIKTPKKQKGKAPAPPPDLKIENKIDSDKSANTKLNFSANFDEISTIEEKESKRNNIINQTDDNIADLKPEIDQLQEKIEETKEYCSDSDMETDNQSSVNTIELNSSDITIHHAEQDSNDLKARKTASTGDLSKIQKGRKSNSGTLERAQSLDITDSGIPSLTKKRKATKDDLESKLSSGESLYETANSKVKEPRLSLALDGLDTFQRNRLKKSTEWGNLEDAIINLNKDHDDLTSNSNEKLNFVEKSPTKFDFGAKDSTFGQSLTQFNEVQVSLVDNYKEGEEIKLVKNVIWPAEKKQNTEIENHLKIAPKPQIVDKKDKIITEKPLEISNLKIHNVLWPVSDSEKTKDAEHLTVQSISIKTLENLDSNSSKIVSKTEIITETEKLTQKPPLPDTSFSLKAQFQEKLNSKLYPTNEIPKNYPIKTESPVFHPGKSSQNFIFAEKYASNNDADYLPNKLYDTNISDDIKVSRHSLGSLERPKSDVLKSVNKLKMQNLISSDQGGVSNVTVTETKQENGYAIVKTIDNHQNESNNDLNVNYDMSTASELYSTAIDSSDLANETSESNKNAIKNITISEAIIDSKYLTSDSPSSLTINTFSDGPDSIKSNTLTFVTEIQVSTASNKNISEFEINTPQQSTSDPQNREETIKKLPEMKFTTSSYETPKTPEKRLSQIELLRSNFEKSPPKTNKTIESSPSKSRIPVATKIDFKTSPERREIKIGEVDMEEKEIVEILSSAVHSTPVVTSQKLTNKPSVRSVTVTAIRTNSKIPSGHATYSHKPPVPARPELSDIHDTRTVSANGSAESTFKQWVFNPNEASVTNIVVNNNKETQK